MSTGNISFVQHLYELYGSGDIDGIVTNCAPEIVWHSGGKQEDFPPFGARKGHGEIRAFFRSVADSLAFQEFTPREFYSDKDKVFVLGTYSMTMKGSGRTASSEWVHIFTIRNGKVVAFREFLDTAHVVAAYRA